MKLFAKSLMKCKSYKERQNRLSESIDQLSFNYSEVCTLLYKEMKRREIESNNPYKMYFSFESSDCFVKLHEGLLLVKNNNIMAKDKYMEHLKNMLDQTIDHGVNIDKTLKICRLIEKSPHLKSIYNHLKYLIQQVYHLNDIKHYNPMRFQLNNFRQNNVNQNQDYLERFNIKPRQNSIIQRSNTKQPYDPSHFELNCYGHYSQEMFATANNHTFDVQQYMCLNLTIVDQYMDETFAKWLRYLKLQKYQWFFNGLSYHEIEFIDKDNIEMFIVKVNKNTITRGAQNKICISTKTLRDRKQKLNTLLLSLDLEVTCSELCEITTYMRNILHYPIPNKNCIVGDELQQDFICAMEKLYNQLFEKLNMSRTLVTSESLLGNSVNKFLECTVLIIGNQMFTKQQVYKTSVFAKDLKYKVYKMPKKIIPRHFN